REVPLREEAAGRVAGEATTYRELAPGGERTDLLPGGEAVGDQVVDDARREGIVELCDVDVGGTAARHAEHALPRFPPSIAAVVVGPYDLGGMYLPEAADQGRRLLQIACALGAGHDEGSAAVREEAAVEETEGRVDQARILMVAERHRLPHLRVGIGRRVLSPLHGDVAVVRAPDPVL